MPVHDRAIEVGKLVAKHVDLPIALTRFRLSKPDPSDLRIGVGNGWDRRVIRLRTEGKDRVSEHELRVVVGHVSELGPSRDVPGGPDTGHVRPERGVHFHRTPVELDAKRL